MKKSGKIELLRFIFASSVIFFHFSLLYEKRAVVFYSIGNFDIHFFNHGNMGVEFFFLVSGFLMAKSIYKKVAAESTAGTVQREYLGPETVTFLWKKVKAIYPYYLPLTVLVIVIEFVLAHHVSVTYLLDRLPSLLFLQRTGIGSSGYIGVSWYIASMLLAMAVIYPLCRKFYYTYTALLAPLFALLILGYLIVATGSVSDTTSWQVITFKCNFRAFAEVGLGTTAYEITRRLEKHVFTRREQILLTILDIIGLLAVLLYMLSALDNKYEGQITLILFMLVTIAFGGHSLLGRSSFWNNRFFCYLGKLSLPIYLSQVAVTTLYMKIFADFSVEVQCVLIYVSILLFSIVLLLLKEKLYDKKIKKG